MTEARHESGFFDVTAAAASLPETAATMLVDHYLTDTPSCSSRVFRVYRPTPAHYHVGCDEHLYVLTGRCTFWIGEPAAARTIGPGEMVVFPRGTVHAMAAIVEEPLTLLSFDTPRRQPRDIVFVDPAEGSPETFMQRNGGDA